MLLNQSILKWSVLGVHRKDWCWSWSSNALVFWGIIDIQFCVSFYHVAKLIHYTYAYIHYFFRFPSHLDYHRALSRVPCAIQYILFHFLFYTEACIYVNPNLPVHPTLFPATVVSICQFSASVFLLLPWTYKQVHLYHQLNFKAWIVYREEKKEKGAPGKGRSLCRGSPVGSSVAGL